LGSRFSAVVAAVVKVFPFEHFKSCSFNIINLYEKRKFNAFSLSRIHLHASFLQNKSCRRDGIMINAQHNCLICFRMQAKTAFISQDLKIINGGREFIARNL
jgi:hypothetical protein